MNIQEFCKKTTLHKLLKDKYVPITPEILNTLNFVKPNYTESDFFSLSSLLNKTRSYHLENNVLLSFSTRQQEAIHNLEKLLKPELSQTTKKGVSLMSILILIPDIHTFIIKTRKRYNINQTTLRKRLLNEPLDTESLLMLRIMKKDMASLNSTIALSEVPIDSQNISKKEKTRQLTETTRAIKQEFNDHNNRIRKFNTTMKKENIDIERFETAIEYFCSDILGLPKVYFGYIKNYILFEVIDKDDRPISKLPNHRYKEPEIEFITEPLYLEHYSKQELNETFEPHITLKIFGNTPKKEVLKSITALYSKDGELDKFKSKTFLKSILSSQSNNLFRDAIATYLIEKEKLSGADTCAVLDYFGIPMTKNNIFRNVKRLKNKLNP